MERKIITTSLEIKLLKQIRYLAVDTDKRINDLIEEALRDLLEKYKKDKH